MKPQIHLTFSPHEISEEFLPLCRQAAQFVPHLHEVPSGGCIAFRKTCSQAVIRVHNEDSKITISAPDVSGAARGLGLALAGISGEASMPFRSLGIMLDVSRNKVFTVDYLKKLLTYLALAGGNTLMLYTEDTFALDEPFFGFKRGAYTLNELQAIDAFADFLGIEMIACIQTLGHSSQFLHWGITTDKITDTPDILLPDAPETYTFIEKMLRFWKQAFRSRRIHIGMDEAHNLGRGKWLDKHSFEDQFSIFTRHLAKVNELCRQNGYENPTIWSDMFFRLNDPSHDYYGNSPFPENLKDDVPANIQLCYWDYYHRDEAFYSNYIKRHRDISPAPVMVASGLWTWSKFWYDYSFSQQTFQPCIKACMKNHVEDLIFTLWGDDGGYCLIDSSLPGIIQAFNNAWGITSDSNNANLFSALTGENWDIWTELSRCEFEGEVTSESHFYAPAAQLWDDPLLMIHHRGISQLAPDHTGQIMKTYEELLLKFPECPVDALSIRTIRSLIQFLHGKLRFYNDLEVAWKNRNHQMLEALCRTALPALKQQLTTFDALHRQSWLACAKPFGLEVIQGRNAVQLARLEECRRRLEEFLEGQIDTIPELDDAFSPLPQGYELVQYRTIASGSIIS